VRWEGVSLPRCFSEGALGVLVPEVLIEVRDCSAAGVDGLTNTPLPLQRDQQDRPAVKWRAFDEAQYTRCKY